MNFKTTAGALGAAVLISATPLVVSAATAPAGPVRLDNVQISQAFGIFNDVNDPGVVSVAFTNETATPVTKVIFTLRAGSDVIDRFTDIGTYRPGVTIRHTFSEGAIGVDEQLAIESVSFADGRAWMSPVAAQLLSRRQSQAQTPATPGELTAEQIRETQPNY